MEQQNTPECSFGKFLIFCIGSHQYGICLNEVLEVIEPLERSVLPESPSYCLGVVNLRGEVVTVIDLRKFLGISDNLTKETFMIVVANEDDKCAYMVDRMVEVCSLQESDIDRNAHIDVKQFKDAFYGVSKIESKVVYLLSLKTFR